MFIMTINVILPGSKTIHNLYSTDYSASVITNKRIQRRKPTSSTPIWRY